MTTQGIEFLKVFCQRPSRYGRLPIPQLYDNELMIAIKNYTLALREDQRAISDALSIEDMRTLRVFAERMAVLAVRDKSVEALRTGILSIVVEDFRFDYREDYLILSLLYRSSEILNCSFVSLVNQCAPHASSIAQKYLLQFAMRPTPIGEMGYIEVGVDNEFIYKRTW